MKTTLTICAIAVATVLVAACSSGGLKPDTDGGVDQGVPDLSVKSDFSVILSGVDLAGLDFKGVSCGNQSCGTGESCCASGGVGGLSQKCVTGDTCTADGGSIDVSCDGPEDCSGGTSNCCAMIGLGGGAPSGDAMCTASCTASASQSGLTTKLCHSAADCTNFSGSTPVGTLDFDSCCTFTGVSYNFCAPGLVAGAVMGVTCQP